MELLTTREFNGIALQCYSDGENQEDFWATREQIGQLLGYSNPGISIGNIHNRNKERLDKYSRVNQIDLPFGGVQAVTVYNFKGLLEICRYSNQPRANAVIDFLWEVADEIRQKGLYLSPQAKENFISNPDFIIKLCEEIKAERAKSSELQTQNNVLAAQVESDKPKVAFADAVDSSKTSILIGSLAKLLCQNGIKIGPIKLFAWLREHGYLISCRGERWNLPKQIYVDRGIFDLKMTLIQNSDGTTKITHTTKVTGKGQIYFIDGFVSGKFKI